MSIWNKILLGLIGFAALFFLYAAARTVKTYQYWAGKAGEFERTLKDRRAELVSLQTADHENQRPDKTIGVEQLRIDLGRVLANRGRIWRCEKQRASLTPAGIMNVTLSCNDPAPFAPNMVFYAFEEGDDLSPGNYLGEFCVQASSEKQVVLASTGRMTRSLDPKLKSLADNVLASKPAWVLYEMMPTDEHEAFQKLTEDQKKWVENAFTSFGMNQAAEEFLNDGQPIDAAGRPSQNPNDKKFERPLRDYLAIFRACEMHRTRFAERMESAIRDLNFLKAAKQEADQLVAMAEKEKTQVSKELERAKAERTAVTGLLAARQSTLKVFKASVEKLIADNVKEAQEVARLQKEANDLIDRRTRSMAQAAAGAN